jgi:LCP family protein required for cell wall assembly
MPGIIPTTTLTRRRAVQLGSAAMLAAMTGAGVARARQAATEYTFVVAGLDYREGHDEHNSDVLMIARVNMELAAVRSVSIPRDLYVEIPGYGADKITRAFHHGFYGAGESWEAGAQMLADTIVTNFGVPVDAVATTTFAGFQQIIDAVGGLEVNNPYEVVDAENELQEPGRWSWPAGPQTLDGASALNFVRTRHMDGDGGRVMRQQLVLSALLAELQKPEVVTELPDLIEAARAAVETNIPVEAQVALIALLPSISQANVVFSTIEPYLYGGTLSSGMWVYQADWATLPGMIQGFLAGGDL